MSLYRHIEWKAHSCFIRRENWKLEWLVNKVQKSVQRCNESDWGKYAPAAHLETPLVAGVGIGKPISQRNQVWQPCAKLAHTYERCCALVSGVGRNAAAVVLQLQESHSHMLSMKRNEFVKTDEKVDDCSVELKPSAASFCTAITFVWNIFLARRCRCEIKSWRKWCTVAS